MSATYDSTAPGSSGISYVRLRLADTSTASAKLSDEEIQAFLDMEPNWVMAASLGARSIAGQFSGKADKSVGKLRIAAGSVAERYDALAEALLREAARRAGVYAGGISIDDMETTEADTDRVVPPFEMGQFDNVGGDSTGALD